MQGPSSDLCFFAAIKDEEKTFVSFINQFTKKKILDDAFKNETATVLIS